MTAAEHARSTVIADRRSIRLRGEGIEAEGAALRVAVVWRRHGGGGGRRVGSGRGHVASSVAAQFVLLLWCGHWRNESSPQRFPFLSLFVFFLFVFRFSFRFPFPQVDAAIPPDCRSPITQPLAHIHTATHIGPDSLAPLRVTSAMSRPQPADTAAAAASSTQTAAAPHSCALCENSFDSASVNQSTTAHLLTRGPDSPLFCDSCLQLQLNW